MRDEIFTGISYHSLDEKNRLFIPPKYRNNKKTFVLTCGIDDCIIMYSLDRWKQVVKKLELVSIKNKNYQRAFIRTFFAEAEIVDVDNQGRILIPKKFKEKYNFKNQIVLVGNKDKLEIWSKDRWEEYYSSVSKIIKKIKSQIDI